MNIVNEISGVLTEAESLRSEVKILREHKVISDFELDQLRRRNAMLEEKNERLVASNSSLKTLLDRAGADLVAGLQRHNIETRDPIGIAEEPRLLVTPKRSEGGIERAAE